MEESRIKGSLVCVTGASGFLGSHIVAALLERGCRVRAAVRDAGDTRKVAHLERMGVELYGADLMQAGSLDAAAQGCDYVVHMASSVRLTARDPQRQIVDVAVETTRTTLGAVARAGSVKRVVQTSSVAAVSDHTLDEGHVFTEDDWNEHATLEHDPYPLSKTLAEREALRLRQEHGNRYELTAINPGVVFGPVPAKIHMRASPALLVPMMSGKMPGCPDLSMPVVDARDVAEVHVRALEVEEPSPRYVCVSATLWMLDIARVLAKSFPDLPVKARRMPSILAYLGSLFTKQLTFTYLWRNLGHRTEFSSERIRSELGIEFRPVEETIVDTARSIIDGGYL